MKAITTSSGIITVIDDEDFEVLSRRRWFAFKNRHTWYVASTGGGQRVYMSRLILGITDPGVMVDHADGNGLNNRRSNLRACSRADNNRNRRSIHGNTSRGVYFHKVTGKWAAVIGIDDRRIHLGLFTNKEDAMRTRDAAAVKYHGKFAVLNYPEAAK